MGQYLLKQILTLKQVAVIGASETRGTIGNALMRNLKVLDFYSQIVSIGMFRTDESNTGILRKIDSVVVKTMIFFYIQAIC